MKDDPFAPESDPYFVVEDADSSRVPRRVVLSVVGAAAAVATLGGCARARVACLPPSATSNHPACVHRFCRYYRGG